MSSAEKGIEIADTPLVDMPMLSHVEVEHLCDFSIAFQAMQTFATPRGMRLTAVIKSGRVKGPRISGQFLPGGGDWIVVGQDRVAALDVRATIRTDDGEHIFVTNSGRVSIPAETAGRFYSGETIRWNEMFARSSPLFETGSEKYAFLNSAVTVAINELSMSHVNYRIYAVK